MQIMPDTGEWIAHKLDLDGIYTKDMLYDPETSIEFGCWYLHFLDGRFDGHVMEMIAAYNAGHGKRGGLAGRSTLFPKRNAHDDPV